jgi:hypothetical protein
LQSHGGDSTKILTQDKRKFGRFSQTVPTATTVMLRQRFLPPPPVARTVLAGGILVSDKRHMGRMVIKSKAPHLSYLDVQNLMFD